MFCPSPRSQSTVRKQELLHMSSINKYERQKRSGGAAKRPVAQDDSLQSMDDSPGSHKVIVAVVTRRSL